MHIYAVVDLQASAKSKKSILSVFRRKSSGKPDISVFEVKKVVTESEKR